MDDFKKLFAQRGYALFEPYSVEDAILDALKSNEKRYALGIPVVIEKSTINYASLLEKSKKQHLFTQLIDMLIISAHIIKNHKKKQELIKIIGDQQSRDLFDETECKQIYDQYSTLEENRTNFPDTFLYYLSFIFAKKQIEILNKLRSRERLTKTEREYYSRTIKKKLRAIRELNTFAQEILGRG